MRVLIVTSTLARSADDPDGAAGNPLHDLFAELGRSVTGTIITPAIDGAPRISELGRLAVLRVGPERPAESLMSAARSPGAARVARVALALRHATQRFARNHDIVHAFWGLPSGWAAAGAGIPLITTFPGSDIHHLERIPVARNVVHRVIRASHTVTANDPIGTARLESLGARRVVHTPSAVPLRRFPVSPSPETRDLVYVGRLAPEKGLHILLQAFALARETEPDLTLRLIGDGPLRSRLEALSRDLCIADAVTFLGTRSPSDVAVDLAQSRALVMASLREGTPHVVIEALATGRPVAGTRVGALPSLVGDTGGVLVEPGDVTGLAKAIQHVALTPYDPEALRASVLHLDESIAAQRLLDLYDRVLHGPPTATAPSRAVARSTPPPFSDPVSVIIAAFNEEGFVASVIQKIKEQPVPVRLIVVDDGSTDGTIDQISSVAHLVDVVVRLPENCGKGAATRAGLACAGRGIVVLFDADEELDARDLLRLIEPIATGRAVFVNGDRFAGTQAPRGHRLQRAANLAYARVGRVVAGTPLHDIASGAKAAPRWVFDVMDLQSTGFELESEIAAKAAALDLGMLEVPIRFVARGYGAGKKLRWRHGVPALRALVRHSRWSPVTSAPTDTGTNGLPITPPEQPDPSGERRRRPESGY